jgi:hypothetical protein
VSDGLDLSAEDTRPRLTVGDDDQELVVADSRLSVTTDGKTLLDLPIAELRRIQFDIERGRPATLVVVPDRANHEPRVVAVPPEQFGTVGELLALVGRRLNGTKGTDG